VVIGYIGKKKLDRRWRRTKNVQCKERERRRRKVGKRERKREESREDLGESPILWLERFSGDLPATTA
jgi:hypothetical protein